MVPSRPTSRAGRLLRQLAGIALVAAVAMGTDAAAAATDTPTPTATPGSAIRSDCPVAIPSGYADRVECGALLVPERRTKQADPAKVVSLPYAVISSTSSSPAEDPLVFPTTGGLGGDTLSALDYFLTEGSWATASRDVILIERRGDVQAEPTLDCPELSGEAMTVDGVYLTGSAAVEHRQPLLQQCYERLIESGVELGGYATRAAAADLADLRAALGYDRWNLYGLGYGTRLALTVMRDHPAGLRTVILDGPYPPQWDAVEALPAGFSGSVQRLIDACAADEPCAIAYPDLGTAIDHVLTAAADSPMSVTIDRPGDREPARVVLDDTTLARSLLAGLSDATVIPTLPFILDQLAQGNPDAAVPLVQKLVDADETDSEGMILSAVCAEVLPFTDQESVDAAYAADPLAAHLGGADIFADCASWPVPELGDREGAAVRSAIPTLVTVGGFDPFTPVAAGNAATRRLPNGVLDEFTRLSHGTIWQSDVDDCAATLARQFLDDPKAEPDASCMEDQPDVVFATTGSIDPTSALYRLDRDLVQDREPVSIGILLASLVLMLGTLAYGIFVAVGRRSRLRGDVPAGAVSAAVAAASFNLVYAAGITLIFTLTDPVTRALGLPSAAWPMLLLPFAGLVMVILLVVLLVRAWMQDDGTLTHRIILSASAAGSLVFAGWLLAHGLLML